jgi:hypothetical protein
MTHSTVEKPGIKQKLARENRDLVTYFLYLASFFLVFRFYTNLILAQHQISYVGYGLCVLKSLALAKVVLMGQSLRLDKSSDRRPLIIQAVYKAALFSVLALVFEVVEHLILGGIHGKAPTEVFEEILDKGWPRLAAMTLIVFVAFLPFFAFRETARALGEGKLQELFFKRRAPMDS